MYIPKRYGQSRIDKCPFCGKQATSVNKQGFPVCIEHKKAIVGEMKCLCGEYLDLKKGKFGPFFNCMKCGNLNIKKVMEFNIIKDVSSEKTKKRKKETSDSKPKKSFARKKHPKEITIRSDDPFYFS